MATTETAMTNEIVKLLKPKVAAWLKETPQADAETQNQIDNYNKLAEQAAKIFGKDSEEAEQAKEKAAALVPTFDADIRKREVIFAVYLASKELDLGKNPLTLNKLVQNAMNSSSSSSSSGGTRGPIDKAAIKARRDKIVDQLESGTTAVPDIAKALGETPAQINSDLKAMEKKGQVKLTQTGTKGKGGKATEYALEEQYEEVTA